MPLRKPVRLAGRHAGAVPASGAPTGQAGAPDLQVESTLDAAPEAVRRALALGLASGALGWGLAVDLDDAESSVSGRSVRACPGIPNFVYISARCDADEKTELETRLWCRSMRLRVVLQALLLGGLLATAGSLLFGWLITWSVPVAMGTGVFAERLLWWRDRRCLRGRVLAFVHNLDHFDQLDQSKAASRPQSEPSS